MTKINTNKCNFCGGLVLNGRCENGCGYQPVEDDSTCTVSTTCRFCCKHENGFYDTVNFWIFRKRVFVCTDCERILEVRK